MGKEQKKGRKEKRKESKTREKIKEKNYHMIPKLYLKEGVKINGAHFYPEIVRMLDVVRATAPLLSDDAVWVTSANDSTHMDGSLHYKNKAFDIRIWNVTGPGRDMSRGWVEKIKLALGDAYDVVLETDHIHLEYDPKE